MVNVPTLQMRTKALLTAEVRRIGFLLAIHLGPTAVTGTLQVPDP